MSGIEILQLGDVCDFVYGKALPSEIRSGEGFPVFGSNGVVGFHKEYLINGPAIIVGRKGSYGEVNWSKENCWAIDTTYYIRPKKQVDLKYLYYYLKVLDLKKINRSTAVPGLNREDVYPLKIHLTSFEQQQKIATILGAAESLIKLRKQAIAKLDELIESVFIEFFGDLNINNKNWEFRELQYFADLSSGVTKGKKYNDSKVLSLPYMRVANVQDGFLNLSEIKEISVSEKDAARYQLRKRDLLLTEGGDPDKLGRGAVWEEEVNNCIHQNHIFRVRIENENLLNAYFLSKCTGSSYGKKYFLKMAKQTTGIATINMTQLKNFPVPLPPIDLQRKYETLIHEVQEQKRLMYDHLLKLQESFQSLLQRAFRGQLEIK